MKIGIPKGYYCHDNKMNTCIYWGMRADLPENENGTCFLLGKSDCDLNEEADPIEVTHFAQNPHRETHRTLEDAHIYNMSMLWDKLKECNAN